MKRFIAIALLLLSGITFAAERVGHPNIFYLDPEFEPAGARIVFQDQQDRAWVGVLDPATGLCVSPTCRDALVGIGLQRFPDRRFFFNGPEWGVSTNGAAIYYSKYIEQLPQLFRVQPDGTGLTQITTIPEGVWGVVPSAAGIVMRATAAAGEMSNISSGWLDERVGILNPLPGLWLNGQGARFFIGSNTLLLYPWTNIASFQLALADVEALTAQVVTANPGKKTQPWGFRRQGAWHAVAILNATALVVYSTEQLPWPVLAELIPPVPGWLTSLEPLNDTDCFAVALQNAPDSSYTDSAIYLACLDGSWTRIDNGTSPVRRSEPEPWLSPTGQWFIYWNEGGALWVVQVDQ